MTLIHFDDAVPPGSQAGSGSAQGDARSDAWRREMEGARLALWLEQRATGSGASRSVGTSVAALHVSFVQGPDRGDARIGVDLSDTSFATLKLREQLAASILEMTGMAVTLAPSPQQVQLAFPVTAPAAFVTEGSQASEPIAGSPDGRQVPTAARDQQDAVRLHCRLSADGVLIWIGSSAVAAVNAEALAARLKLVLARQSLRLTGLVHNGQPVPVDGGSASSLFVRKSHEEST